MKATRTLACSFYVTVIEGQQHTLGMICPVALHVDAQYLVLTSKLAYALCLRVTDSLASKACTLYSPHIQPATCWAWVLNIGLPL